MGVKMTERQKEVYDFIVSYIQENLFPPSHSEIGQALFMTRTAVCYHLKNLRKKNLIEIKNNAPRGIEVKGYKFVKKEEN